MQLTASYSYGNVTVISIDTPSIDYGAEKYNWEVRMTGGHQYDDYPLSITKYEPSLSIYLPPLSTFEVRVQQYTGPSSSWSSWFTIEAIHYTSYDKGRILSGEAVSSTTIVETASGATATNN